MLNSSLKDLKPAAPTGPVPRGQYIEARDALVALGYPLEEVEKVLNDLPPQQSAEQYIKAALRRIGSRP